ncbi:hypothetical protein EW146_g622 [Bondarzewia mesenterica]|uniref:Uncharacterized protein n=1 Tax=Bondarzewia mesenterica TaxID=1095465 RepID=A0A4S4MCK5_9AGAM|nr:hypothetical protein EW146_g622 [Bondarzewia mesenterica]
MKKKKGKRLERLNKVASDQRARGKCGRSLLDSEWALAATVIDAQCRSCANDTADNSHHIPGARFIPCRQCRLLTRLTASCFDQKKEYKNMSDLAGPVPNV